MKKEKKREKYEKLSLIKIIKTTIMLFFGNLYSIWNISFFFFTKNKH